jgi:hypothetical protein
MTAASGTAIARANQNLGQPQPHSHYHPRPSRLPRPAPIIGSQPPASRTPSGRRLAGQACGPVPDPAASSHEPAAIRGKQNQQGSYPTPATNHPHPKRQVIPHLTPARFFRDDAKRLRYDRPLHRQMTLSLRPRMDVLRVPTCGRCRAASAHRQDRSWKPQSASSLQPNRLRCYAEWAELRCGLVFPALTTAPPKDHPGDPICPEVSNEPWRRGCPSVGSGRRGRGRCKRVSGEAQPLPLR